VIHAPREADFDKGRTAAEAQTRALDSARCRTGNERAAIDHLGIPPTAVGRVGHIEGLGGVIPNRLGVGDVHVPGDLGIGGCDLAEYASLVVVAVDAKTRGLLGHRSLRVLEGSAGCHPRHLRTEVESLLAVAHAGKPHGRMDGDASHSRQVGRGHGGGASHADGRGSAGDGGGLKEFATREQCHGRHPGTQRGPRKTSCAMFYPSWCVIRRERSTPCGSAR